MDPKKVFDDGVLSAELIDNGWVVIRWLTNDVGYLAKSCVRDFRQVERMIETNGWRGWLMGSEIANTVMHKIIEKLGGVRLKKDDLYIYFKKEFVCAEQ